MGSNVIETLKLKTESAGYTNTAKRVKLSRSSLYKMLNTHKNPTLETLEKLANNFGFSVRLIKIER